SAQDFFSGSGLAAPAWAIGADREGSMAMRAASARVGSRFSGLLPIWEGIILRCVRCSFSLACKRSAA
uniref:Uncharacterized protein n=1 Tax=Aegilops tauschii subsp. strangulata TaxID=200361 RepID=A0A453ITF8_AEGTS